MNMTLNGCQRQTDVTTVRQLIIELGFADRAVAVEVNKNLVPKREHECTPLHEGDQVEVVALVGGG